MLFFCKVLFGRKTCLVLFLVIRFLGQMTGFLLLLLSFDLGLVSFAPRSLFRKVFFFRLFDSFYTGQMSSALFSSEAFLNLFLCDSNLFLELGSLKPLKAFFLRFFDRFQSCYV